MSDALKKLIENWNEEKVHFEIVSKRFHDSSDTLRKLNELIYAKCQEECYDIKLVLANKNKI